MNVCGGWPQYAKIAHRAAPQAQAEQPCSWPSSPVLSHLTAGPTTADGRVIIGLATSPMDRSTLPTRARTWKTADRGVEKSLGQLGFLPGLLACCLTSSSKANLATSGGGDQD